MKKYMYKLMPPECYENLMNADYKVKCIRDYYRGNWEYVLYDQNKFTEKDIENFATEYFNSGEEVIMYSFDTEGVFNTEEEGGVYLYNSYNDETRKVVYKRQLLNILQIKLNYKLVRRNNNECI